MGPGIAGLRVIQPQRLQEWRVTDRHRVRTARAVSESLGNGAAGVRLASGGEVTGGEEVYGRCLLAVSHVFSFCFLFPLGCKGMVSIV